MGEDEEQPRNALHLEVWQTLQEGLFDILAELGLGYETPEVDWDHPRYLPPAPQSLQYICLRITAFVVGPEGPARVAGFNVGKLFSKKLFMKHMARQDREREERREAIRRAARTPSRTPQRTQAPARGRD